MPYDVLSGEKENFCGLIEKLSQSPKAAAALCSEELQRAGYRIFAAKQNVCGVIQADQTPIGLTASLCEPVCAAAVLSAARTLAGDGAAVAVWFMEEPADQSAVFVRRRPFALFGVAAAPEMMEAVVECEPAVQVLASITGFTAHGARPHLGVNAVDAACLAASAVHALPLPPFFPAAVRVLSIDAGNSSINMIPNQVSMIIEARSDDGGILQTLTERIGDAVQNAVAALSAKAKLTTRPVENIVCAALAAVLHEHAGIDAPPQTAAKCNPVFALARYLQCEAACLRIGNAGGEGAAACCAAYADALYRSAAILHSRKEAQS